MNAQHRQAQPSQSTRALGLYVHSPFCAHKCGYCDFNSWAETALEPQKQWLEALSRQMNYWSRVLTNKFGHTPLLETVFMGGGTPSLLGDVILRTFAEKLKETFVLQPGYEWTIECNPESLSLSKLQLFKELGVSRLSIGVQSFNADALKRLERQTTVQANHKTLELVSEHWRGPWSMDLMFGLPEQTLGDWEHELEQAARYPLEHLSAYQLTLSTARSRNWKQPAEAELESFYRNSWQLIGDKLGLKRYEISNYAKNNRAQCRHNLKYWKLHPFLGIGPGAAGLLAIDGAYGVHQKQPENFERWRQGAGLDAQERSCLSPRVLREHVQELLMMGLRLNEGLAAAALGEAFVKRLLADSQASEFIELIDARLRCNPQGFLLLNTLLERLFVLVDTALDSGDLDPTLV